MTGLYGNTWTSNYGDQPRSLVGAEWARTLAGLNRAQIDAGFDACRTEGAEFPPSAPRFRSVCLGIPSFAVVNVELLTRSNAERSPFSRLVWQHIDGHAHRHASASDAKRTRKEAYDVTCELVMRGELLPVTVAGEIEHVQPVVNVARPEVARRYIAEIQTLLAGAAGAGRRHTPPAVIVGGDA
ncbi:hypothetical protein ACFOLC_00900 [Lysobacter cavernae]|uniref:Uncharacterized protein n=1 Tax=Lysobacter cavernae TaxID=1685901 RepID=A0ABV7RMZ3_9GAMM